MANSNLRIMLVDDDELILDLMSANMKECGVREVMVASNGAQALSMLADGQHFDVILTDLNMPQMDGIELMRHLAQLRDAGILQCCKRGKEVYYSVCAPHLVRTLRAIADAMEACCPPANERNEDDKDAG